MSGSEIRLGLVGVGKIALDQHIPAISANAAFELVATASPGYVSEGIAAHSNLAEMLAAGHDLDAVAICTPPAIRSAIATSALRAGLHVLLEKPPATALSQLRVMQSEAAKAGRALFTAWHSRETAAVDAARDWLAHRHVRNVRVIWREDVKQWHPGQDWLLGPGGLGVFDPGINALSILTRILPGPLALEGADLFVPENRAAPMRAALLLRHHQDCEVTCDFDILHSGHQEWTIEITTDAGLLTLADGGHRMIVAGNTQAAADETEYGRLYDRFASLVARSESDVDADPLMLVADAMMLGTVQRISPFAF
jgi:predicted dehydrogenase